MTLGALGRVLSAILGCGVSQVIEVGGPSFSLEAISSSDLASAFGSVLSTTTSMFSSRFIYQIHQYHQLDSQCLFQPHLSSQHCFLYPGL